MTMMKNIRIYMAALAFLTVSMGTGCSYVSDMVEGAITKRSGFSITADYDSVLKRVTVTWDELDSSDNFAGYEIYITSEKDDEYAGYELVASRYVNNGAPSLHESATNNYIHNASAIASGTLLDGPGRYFYRVGIINWDDNPSKRTRDKGYDVDIDGVWIDNEINYNAKTNIDKISGYVPVDIN